MTQTTIITGASDGIGRAAAAARHRVGDDVVIVGRNPDKTRTVAEELGVAYHIADFAKLDDVRALAVELNKLERIDVLANNAGGVQSQRTITADGYETTFQTNHLAPFLLTNLLLPKLIASNAKVLNTSSAANLAGRVDLDNLNYERGYKNFKAYATSKLENIFFTQELAHRYGSDGIRTAAFHPGVVASNFAAESSPFIRAAYHTPLKKILNMKTVAQGADTLLWLIEADNPRTWQSGNYYADRHYARYNQQVHDLQIAHGLWERSLDMVGLTHGTAKQEEPQR